MGPDGARVGAREAAGPHSSSIGTHGAAEVPGYWDATSAATGPPGRLSKTASPQLSLQGDATGPAQVARPRTVLAV
ncbi:unnamed protein product [Amoebophrya sp. A120]|nr:unnamed protein product [Amoebophrya sp. A120]|eukprot:GSA120T00000593001.1